MATTDFNVTSTLAPSGAPTLSRYALRIAARRAKRLGLSPQGRAARTRAALRNHTAATLHDDALTTKAAAGDVVAMQLLGVSRGE